MSNRHKADSPAGPGIDTRLVGRLPTPLIAPDPSGEEFLAGDIDAQIRWFFEHPADESHPNP